MEEQNKISFFMLFSYEGKVEGNDFKFTIKKIKFKLPISLSLSLQFGRKVNSGFGGKQNPSISFVSTSPVHPSFFPHSLSHPPLFP